MSDIFRDYSFGGWIRETRTKNGITLRAAANSIDMDAGNFSKLERSELDPPKSREKIARIVDMIGGDDALFKILLSLAFQHHLSKLKEQFQ